MSQKSAKRKKKRKNQLSNPSYSQSRMGEKPQRNHKDSTFCLLFSEPQRAIELYNAVTGENLPPDTELTYTTLKNAIYIDRNNDLSFVVNDRYLVMSECQSTINMNIPMRCLGYVNRTLENLAGREGLYGRHLVKFPAPEFYVFYVGMEAWSRKTLRLSESFLAEPIENSLELVVNLINLNYNKDSEILQRSPSLLGYSKLLYHIQEELGANGGDLKQAIDTAVKACMDEGLITDFLHKHSKEVTGMLFKEITVEEFAEIRAREAYADGEKVGYEVGREEGEKTGLARGAAQEKREIAKKFKDSGISIEVIARNTGLTPEEIESLLQSITKAPRVHIHAHTAGLSRTDWIQLRFIALGCTGHYIACQMRDARCVVLWCGFCAARGIGR